MTSISERNRRILEMRQQGFSQKETAMRFKLSPSRIQLIEKQDAAERSMAERRSRLREAIRSADDPDRMWPVLDLIDALGLSTVTQKRLMAHFMQAGKQQISLRELMDMCSIAPVDDSSFVFSPLLRVKGVGKIGYWAVVNGLTEMDLGKRCNEEWEKRLKKVKETYC
jgi:hypothetical protein